ncbi:Phosphoribosyl-ATP pyrophosphohydrolase-domain containing protein (two domains) [Yasminevirus sp. GU-2018]|uniref:Phosphoribosyl-ATP pyrophosphohydrolase-domain containing protein (Two domains) n=1 Tax=Yasminevirus sp. GU-2018 TaxID=2420051 RepID=A0A5K0UA17_9VIRU|nr:Phosphoribosyl-ATP pyrophosphohydrolase-domain containing protein (two domains) [Yasminevirus sp. GU-2018]
MSTVSATSVQSIQQSVQQADKSADKSKNVMSHFQLVGEFHDVFGHPQRTELYETCFETEPKLVPFRISLIREELNEFKDALKKKDVVEMFDALCDLSYVTNGAGQCLGINLDKLLLKRNRSIDSNAEPYCVSDNVLETMSEQIEKGLKLINDAVDNFCGSAETQDLEEMGQYLVEILQATYDLGHTMGGNMDLMFREVHRSNMTKVCDNIEDAKASVEFYEKEGRYSKPTIRTKGRYFVVYDATTTKILKNHKWEQPNLKQFF